MNTEAVLSGIVLVLFVILLVVLHKAKKARAEEQGSDVGLAVFVEDPTPIHDCDGCDECGAPMVVDEDRPWWYDDFDSTGAALVYYGSRLVHQKCLIARRDGLTACTGCAAILSAVTL